MSEVAENVTETQSPQIEVIKKDDASKPCRSYSAWNTYMKCPRKYKYVYVDRKPRYTSPAMFLGTACHKAQEIYLRKKLVGELMSKTDLQDAVADFWEESLTQLPEDQRLSMGGEKDKLMQLTSIRYPQLEEINPKYIEEDITVYPDGLDFGIRGIIDLVTANNELRDLKTSSSSPPGAQTGSYRPMQGHDLQLALYAYLMKEGLGVEPSTVWVDYMVKTSYPKVVSVQVEMPQAKIDHVLTAMVESEHAIQDGIFPRNRTALGCSPKGCPYWDECVGY